MTMTRKKCWICGRPVYSKISDICRPCERAWRVLVLKEREKDNIDECYGCIWKGTHRDLFPCSECRGSGKEGPDWYSPAGEPLVYRDDASAGETERDSSDLISRQAAIEAIAGRDKTNGNTVYFKGKTIIGYLKDLPSVQPKTGRWKLVDHLWQCDQCQYRQNEMAPTNFCPSCGAKMRL